MHGSHCTRGAICITSLQFHNKRMSLKLSGSQYADEETEANHIPKISMILLSMLFILFYFIYVSVCLNKCTRTMNVLVFNEALTGYKIVQDWSTDGCELHVGAGNHSWVICNKSKCF